MYVLKLIITRISLKLISISGILNVTFVKTLNYNRQYYFLNEPLPPAAKLGASVTETLPASAPRVIMSLRCPLYVLSQIPLQFNGF